MSSNPKVVREALEFYAEQFAKMRSGCIVTGVSQGAEDALHIDCGDRARAALSALDAEPDEGAKFKRKHFCDGCGETLMYCACDDNPLNVKPTPSDAGEELAEKDREQKSWLKAERDKARAYREGSPIPGALENAQEAANGAYAERNRLVATLAKLFPSHLSPAVPAADGWNWVVIVDGPSGQMSWHIPDSEYEDFNFLEDWPNDYDGHSTEEKYRRLAGVRALQRPQGMSGEDREFLLSRADYRLCSDGKYVFTDEDCARLRSIAGEVKP